MSRLSQSLNNRNQSLAELLKTAGDVTGILSERSQQVNSLILNANDLVACSTTAGTPSPVCSPTRRRCRRQLSGLVADNEKELAPALEKLNSVTAMLEKNRDNLAKVLPGAGEILI